MRPLASQSEMLRCCLGPKSRPQPALWAHLGLERDQLRSQIPHARGSASSAHCIPGDTEAHRGPVTPQAPWRIRAGAPARVD